MVDYSPPLHPVVAAVTERIVERSRESREAYLARIDAATGKGASRSRLGCTNLAHAFAASERGDKEGLKALAWPILRSLPRTTTCSRRTSRSSVIPP